MKCENCRSEWSIPPTLKNSITKCPFCNAPLFEKKENNDIRSALKWIVDSNGIEVFKESEKINGILADLAKGQEKDRRRIRIALSLGAGTIFYNILSRNNGLFRDPDVKLFQSNLEEYGFAKEFSTYILNMFLFSASLPEIDDQFAPVITDVSNDNHREIESKETEINNPDDREFDELFSLLKEKYPEKTNLRKLAFKHDAKHTNAMLVYGLYLIKRNLLGDEERGLSFLAEAANRKNDRAAYILGWLHETSLLYSGDKGKCRKWYGEAAERGYQPAIQKKEELMKNGFYSSNPKNIRKRESKIIVEETKEIKRLRSIQAYLKETKKGIAGC